MKLYPCAVSLKGHTLAIEHGNHTMGDKKLHLFFNACCIQLKFEDKITLSTQKVKIGPLSSYSEELSASKLS
jgi:hypothetical protein